METKYEHFWVKDGVESKLKEALYSVMQDLLKSKDGDTLAFWEITGIVARAGWRHNVREVDHET